MHCTKTASNARRLSRALNCSRSASRSPTWTLEQVSALRPDVTHFSHVTHFVPSDYRRIPRTLSHVYYNPLTPDNRREIDKIFAAYTSDPADPVIRNRQLETWGRVLLVPESTSKVAKFRFNDLCGKPLSAADYIEITNTFGTIFVVDVPKMGLSQKDLVRLRSYPVITGADCCPPARRGDSSPSLMRAMRARCVVVRS